MKEFRYEAIDASRQPVHGILAADSRDALRELLARKGQELISAVSIEIPAQPDNVGSIPSRLSQLRVSESVRTAFATQLPVDVILTASAREPSWSPASALLPWGQFGSLVLLFLASLHAGTSGTLTTPFIVSASLALLIFGPIWLLVRRSEQQPKELLIYLAERLQAGRSDIESMSRLLPGSLGEIAASNLTEEQKLLAVSELLSSSSGSGFARHRLFLNLLGPVCLLLVALGVCYAFLDLVVPGFREIFEGFGLDLPAMTTLVISVSSAVQKLGLPGAIALLIFAGALVIALSMIIYRGWLNRTLQTVPLLGAGLSWINLAGVARWLAAMLRSNAAPDEALRVAVRQSANEEIRQDGTHIAALIEDGRSPDKVLTSLSGLPLAMLSGIAQSPSDAQRRDALASTLDSLAAMFERAVFSSGYIIAGFVQAIIIVLVSGTVGMVVLALFLPLVQLLNDLS